MDAQDFLKYAVNTLKADPAYQDVDMSTTSPLYNMTILPFAIMSKPIQDMVANVFSQLKLTNMTESQLDDFATGYFIARRSGTLSTVDVTLYFTLTNQTVEPIIIYATDEFRTSSGAVFNPIQDYIFAYNILPLDPTHQYRIANITVSSTTLTNQIDPNTINTTSFLHPNLSSITNASSSSVPIESETNAEFIVDLENSLSERSLSKASGIIVNLKNAFTYLTDIMAIGYGDPEMQRDIAVAAKAWSGHMGAAIDVYSRSNLSSNTFTVTANVNGDGYAFIMRRYKGYDWNATDSDSPYPQSLTPWILLSGNNLPILPVIDIDWDNSTISNTSFVKNSTGLYDYTIEVMPDPELGSAYGKNYRYSIYEYLRITIKTAAQINPTETINLKYDTLFGAEDVQNFLNENRDIASSTILRSYIPILITDLNITYDRNYSVDETAWATKLMNEINTWSANEPIRLISLLKDFEAPLKINEIWKDEDASLPYVVNSSGIITGTQTPGGTPSCYAAMLLHNINGSRAYYLSTQQISTIVVTGLSASPRTSRYFIKPGAVRFTKGSW